MVNIKESDKNKQINKKRTERGKKKRPRTDYQSKHGREAGVWY